MLSDRLEAELAQDRPYSLVRLVRSHCVEILAALRIIEHIHIAQGQVARLTVDAEFTKEETHADKPE